MSDSAPEYSAPKPGALSGLRLIELGEGIASAYAGMLLADMGADVVKVVLPNARPAPSIPGLHVWNRNKRSVAIDYESDEAAQARLRSLVCGVDILLHDFAPGAAAAVGLGPVELQEQAPHLVICHISPYGEEGPYRDLAPDPNIAASLGNLIGAQVGYRPGPTFLVLPLASYAAAILAASGISAALFVREQTGLGQVVATSLLAGALSMRNAFLKASAVPFRLKARDPLSDMPSFRLYQAGDGLWFAVAATNVEFYTRLCIALGRPELIAEAHDPLAPVGIPSDRAPDVIATLTEIFATDPRAHWLKLLQEHDVAAAPVQSRAEFMATDLVRVNDMAASVDDPLLGRTIQMGFPIDGTLATGMRAPAPLPGQNTHEVLSEAPQPVRTAVARGSAARAPLAGVRVLDASTFVAGPLAATYLSDLGADVIKLEGPGGDGLRGGLLGFIPSNRGKRGLSYDHSQPEGRELFEALIRSADIYIESFRPRARARLNLDYEALSALNPRLIQCSITGYGRSKQLEEFPSFDPVLGALSGAYAAQGGVGHPPIFNTASNVNDLGTTLLTVLGVLTSLYRRECTGEGSHISVPQVNASIAMQSGELVFYEGSPAIGDGAPDMLGTSATYRLFETAERWIFLALAKPEHWPVLCRILGLDGLARTVSGPEATASAVDSSLAGKLARRFRERTAHEWVELLVARGVPCVPAHSIDDAGFDPDDILRDPQVEANDLVVSYHHPVYGDVRQAAKFLKFSLTPAPYEGTAPRRGEHNEEIMRDLGYSSERITSLRERGVLLEEKFRS